MAFPQPNQLAGPWFLQRSDGYAVPLVLNFDQVGNLVNSSLDDAMINGKYDSNSGMITFAPLPSIRIVEVPVRVGKELLKNFEVFFGGSIYNGIVSTTGNSNVPYVITGSATITQSQGRQGSSQALAWSAFG